MIAEIFLDSKISNLEEQINKFKQIAKVNQIFIKDMGRNTKVLIEIKLKHKICYILS